MTDKRLVCGTHGLPIRGVQSDLDAMYRREAPRLARYFARRYHGREDPDDLVHELFARLASGCRSGEVRNPKRYLARTLRNYVIDRHRAASAAPKLVTIDEEDAIVAADQAQKLELADMQERYRRAVCALPPRTREVFLKHRVDDQSVKVIAQALTISTRTVEWHLAEAIARISKALDTE